MNRDQYIRRWEMYKHRQSVIPPMTPAAVFRGPETSCEANTGHLSQAKWDAAYASTSRMHGSRFS